MSVNSFSALSRQQVVSGVSSFTTCRLHVRCPGQRAWNWLLSTSAADVIWVRNLEFPTFLTYSSCPPRQAQQNRTNRTTLTARNVALASSSSSVLRVRVLRAYRNAHVPASGRLNWPPTLLRTYGVPERPPGSSWLLRALDPVPVVQTV